MCEGNEVVVVEVEVVVGCVGDKGGVERGSIGTYIESHSICVKVMEVVIVGMWGDREGWIYVNSEKRMTYIKLLGWWDGEGSVDSIYIGVVALGGDRIRVGEEEYKGI